jgi:hypothetical protein
MVEIEVHSVQQLKDLIRAKLKEIEMEGMLIVLSENNAKAWFKNRMSELKQLLDDAKPLCVFVCERCGFRIDRHY